MRSRQLLLIFSGLCMAMLPFFIANLVGNFICIVGWALVLLGMLQITNLSMHRKRAIRTCIAAIFLELPLFTMLLSDKSMNILYVIIGMLAFGLEMYVVYQILSMLYEMAQQQNQDGLARRIKKSRIFTLLLPAVIGIGYLFSTVLPGALPYLLPAVFFLFILSAVLLAYRHLDPTIPVKNKNAGKPPSDKPL